MYSPPVISNIGTPSDSVSIYIYALISARPKQCRLTLVHRVLRFRANTQVIPAAVEGIMIAVIYKLSGLCVHQKSMESDIPSIYKG
jgi:hypothetical protein